MRNNGNGDFEGGSCTSSKLIWNNRVGGSKGRVEIKRRCADGMSSEVFEDFSPITEVESCCDFLWLVVVCGWCVSLCAGCDYSFLFYEWGL